MTFSSLSSRKDYRTGSIDLRTKSQPFYGQAIDWRRYEVEKRALRNLTPAQYEVEVQKIARRLGV